MVEKLMGPGAVAVLLQATTKSVNRWADAGELQMVKTPGGHRRFKVASVRAFMLAHGYDLPDELRQSRPAEAAA